MLSGLPSLPTDNLYKFVSLSGVAMMIVGVIGPWTTATTIQERGYAHTAEDALLDAEWGHLDKAQTRLQMDVNAQTERLEAIAAAVESEPEKVDLSEFEALRAEALALQAETLGLKERAEKTGRSVQELGLRNVRLTIEHEALDSMRKDFKVVARAAWGTSIVGMLLAAWGFHQWYYRVQRHLDAEIARASSLPETPKAASKGKRR